jgi:hypothetical protein
MMHNCANGQAAEPETLMPKRKMTFDQELAAEAKSIVALAFRNGPIEGVPRAENAHIAPGKPNTHTSPRMR